MCSSCYCTAPTFIIQPLDPFNLVFIPGIDPLIIPRIHEVPHAEEPQYKESLCPGAVSASGGIQLDCF